MLKSNNFNFGNQIIVFVLFTNYDSHMPNPHMMFCARDHNFQFHINADHGMLLVRKTRRVWLGFFRLGYFSFC